MVTVLPNSAVAADETLAFARGLAAERQPLGRRRRFTLAQKAQT